MLFNVKRMMNVGLTDPSFSYKTVFISDVNFPGRKFVSPLPAVYFEQLRLFLRAEESKIEQGKIASSLFPSLCSHFLFIFFFDRAETIIMATERCHQVNCTNPSRKIILQLIKLPPSLGPVHCIPMPLQVFDKYRIHDQ